MLGTQEQRTEGMKRQSQELIDQAYHRGFKAGREDRQAWEKDQADRLIEKGRNEAWEAARKVIKMDEYHRKWEVFPECDDGEYPFDKVFASDAIDRIRAYEEQKKQEEDSEIHVGDEVERKNVPGKFIVQSISKIYANCMDCDGGQWTLKFEDIRKTGKHYPEIAEVLKKMKKGE